MFEVLAGSGSLDCVGWSFAVGADDILAVLDGVLEGRGGVLRVVVDAVGEVGGRSEGRLVSAAGGEEACAVGSVTRC